MIDLASLTALRAVDDHGSVVAAAEALGLHAQRDLAAGQAAGAADQRGAARAGGPRGDAHPRGPAPGRRRQPAARRPRDDRVGPAPAGRHRRRAPADHRVLHGDARPGRPAGARRSATPTPTSLLSLTEREPWDTVELIATGQADVGVAHSWGDVTLAIPDHLETTSLADDVADVIVPVGHRLAKRAPGHARTTSSTRAGSPPRTARSAASGSRRMYLGPDASPGSPTSPWSSSRTWPSSRPASASPWCPGSAARARPPAWSPYAPTTPCRPATSWPCTGAA